MLHNCHIQESSSTAAAFTWEPKMRKLFRSPPPVYELEALLGNYKGGTHHVDQVFPNLFLGDVNIARDRKKLRTMGITHILNVAHASWEFTGDNIDYGPDIQYYGITIEDCPDFDISVFLRPGAKFIHNALSTPGEFRAKDPASVLKTSRPSYCLSIGKKRLRGPVLQCGRAYRRIRKSSCALCSG
ncbi:dual specificity protein phosphatase 13A-like isoform X3 [Lithobates pipiens]